MFAVALLGSLAVHLPVYEVLGELAEVLLHEPSKAAPSSTSTIEFELADAEEQAEDAPPEPELPAPAEPKSEPEPKPRRAQRAEAVPEPPKPQPVVPVQPVPEPEPPRPQVPDTANKLAVTQKSDDPDVEPPPDAQFIAEENRRVAEETVARQRNMQVDEEPQTAQGPESDDSMTNAGDSDESDVADLRDVDGSDARAARPEEAVRPPEQTHQPSQGEAAGATDPARESRAAAPERAPKVAVGGPQVGGEPEPLVINDGNGTIVIRRPNTGAGPGAQGDAQRLGEQARRDDGARASRGQKGVDLRVSWSQFEGTFGEETLARAREEAQVAQRRSRLRGHGRDRRWRKFKSAIENFVPNVKPGNQTALNAAASPFAHYLATIHRNIHREFALGFLRNLPVGGGAFDDVSLMTKLEIIINRDGSIHKVGVVETSGFMPFDFGAFDAVMRAAPFAPPPRNILSGDGRVYVHWGFYRNHRQCGTFNASPFILKGPAEMQRPPGGTPDSDRVPADSEYGWVPAGGALGHGHVHGRGGPGRVVAAQP